MNRLRLGIPYIGGDLTAPNVSYELVKHILAHTSEPRDLLFGHIQSQLEAISIEFEGLISHLGV